MDQKSIISAEATPSTSDPLNLVEAAKPDSTVTKALNDEKKLKDIQKKLAGEDSKEKKK